MLRSLLYRWHDWQQQRHGLPFKNQLVAALMALPELPEANRMKTRKVA